MCDVFGKHLIRSLLELLAAIPEGEKIAPLFGEDGVVELPFLHSVRIHHVAEGGEIKLLRESLNVVAAAQALLPGGVTDLPRPSDEIYSFKPGYQS